MGVELAATLTMAGLAANRAMFSDGRANSCIHKPMVAIGPIYTESAPSFLLLLQHLAEVR